MVCILCSTLIDNTAERLTRETAGQHSMFSKLIVERLQMQGNWGFTLTSMELCMVVKGNLSSPSRTTRFVDNMLGHDFVADFLRHYPVLTMRGANMVKELRQLSVKRQ
jgi:hypothetical protein